jgi:hypothetical protein
MHYLTVKECKKFYNTGPRTATRFRRDRMRGTKAQDPPTCKKKMMVLCRFHLLLASYFVKRYTTPNQT